MAQTLDTPQKYGSVSRLFHWGMAAVFLMQFASAIAHAALERDDALRQFLWGFHVPLGTLLFILVFFRGAWGFYNLKNRHTDPSPIGKAAKAGHIAMYALMLLVPFSRLLASAGSTRGLSVFGLQVVPPQTTEIAWTQVLANFHGEMGWLLFALIIGHIVMAVGYHKMHKKDGTLEKML
jgi:cytochrome b561